MSMRTSNLRSYVSKMESGAFFQLWRTSTAQKILQHTQGRDSGEMPPFGVCGELKHLLDEHALFLLNGSLLIMTLLYQKMQSQQLPMMLSILNLPGGHGIYSIEPLRCAIRQTSLHACSLHGPRASSIEQYLIVAKLNLVNFHRCLVAKFWTSFKLPFRNYSFLL